MTIAGAIISGGAASRLNGRPKGLEIVGGARIIDRVADALRPHCDALFVAPGSLDPAGWITGAEVAPDLLAVKASITGIHAAVSAARGDVIAIAWDMPFVSSALIGELRRRLIPGAPAVIPFVNGRPEPLCAAYSSRVAAPIADAVRSGTFRISEILARIPGIVWIDDADLRAFGDPETMFFNVNTAADLDRAERIAESM